uniref:Putative ovule protein n=1 Tax=Solanum chacoense TaxID=4108 RepID=A0A0V0GS78_SOLCH
MSDSCKRELLEYMVDEEYGISESGLNSRISMSSIARLVLWNDGEILLQNNCRIEELNSYNPKDEFLRKVNVYRGSAVVTTYIPQLLLTQDCRW